MKRISFSLLHSIEAIGRRLPHPTLVFALLCGIIILASACFAALNASAIHPVTGITYLAKSLVSQEGLIYMLTNTVSNFMNFAPLGPVLVAMLGIGLADHSGYLPALVKNLAAKSPKAMLSYAVVFIGVLSNIAADAGYVVLIPLAAMIFMTYGRHPLAGIAAAFAGVSGGYSANLVIGPVDIILSGITTEAAQILDKQAIITASSNYWFLLASTFFITLLGGLITDKIVEPYLQKSHQSNTSSPVNGSPITPELLPVNTQAFRWASVTGLFYVLFLLALYYWQIIPFEHVMSGLIVLIALGFALVGLVYGELQRKFSENAVVAPNSELHSQWIVQALEKTFSSLAGYMVLMFFAAQFVAYFNWTQIGTLSAIHGASFLAGLAIPPFLLLIMVIFFSAAVNLLIGSASAKWALMAPILVPLFMLLEVDPALIQLAYRIGDSSTNIITPLMPYFALILAYAQQYDKNAHLGTIMAIMMPYSLLFIGGWILMLAIWLNAGLAIGF